MGLGIKTYIQFKLGELLGKHPPKFEGHYSVWRARRLHAILDHYGHRFFDGKSLLELGAGYGAIGAFFSMLNAKVTCVEGRAANVAVIRQRFPFLAAIHHDLTSGLPTTTVSPEHWDIIIHMGVLYHLNDPEASLRQTCNGCTHLVLETECSDSDDPYFTTSAEEKTYIYDQSLDGIGSRPSPAFVERVLRESGMTFTRIDDERCNWELHRYDWPILNSKQARNGQRRMWFAENQSQVSERQQSGHAKPNPA